jgi:lipoprotein NlpD
VACEGGPAAPVTDITMLLPPVQAPRPSPVASKIGVPKQPVFVGAKKPLKPQVTGQRQPMHWLWPVAEDKTRQVNPVAKGVDIQGKWGEAIYAAASGTVVYSGNGLLGYGNLIIIKHDNIYLSAYAHNSKNFVQEGQAILKGQKIAEMGNSGTNKVVLHFEIRKEGQPENILQLRMSYNKG